MFGMWRRDVVQCIAVIYQQNKDEAQEEGSVRIHFVENADEAEGQDHGGSSRGGHGGEVARAGGRSALAFFGWNAHGVGSLWRISQTVNETAASRKVIGVAELRSVVSPGSTVNGLSGFTWLRVLMRSQGEGVATGGGVGFVIETNQHKTNAGKFKRLAGHVVRSPKLEQKSGMLTVREYYDFLLEFIATKDEDRAHVTAYVDDTWSQSPKGVQAVDRRVVRDQIASLRERCDEFARGYSEAVACADLSAGVTTAVPPAGPEWRRDILELVKSLPQVVYSKEGRTTHVQGDSGTEIDLLGVSTVGSFSMKDVALDLRSVKNADRSESIAVVLREYHKPGLIELRDFIAGVDAGGPRIGMKHGDQVATQQVESVAEPFDIAARERFRMGRVGEAKDFRNMFRHKYKVAQMKKEVEIPREVFQKEVAKQFEELENVSEPQPFEVRQKITEALRAALPEEAPMVTGGSKKRTNEKGAAREAMSVRKAYAVAKAGVVGGKRGDPCSVANLFADGRLAEGEESATQAVLESTSCKAELFSKIVFREATTTPRKRFDQLLRLYRGEVAARVRDSVAKGEAQGKVSRLRFTLSQVKEVFASASPTLKGLLGVQQRACSALSDKQCEALAAACIKCIEDAASGVATLKRQHPGQLKTLSGTLVGKVPGSSVRLVVSAEGLTRGLETLLVRHGRRESESCGALGAGVLGDRPGASAIVAPWIITAPAVCEVFAVFVILTDVANFFPSISLASGAVVRHESGNSMEVVRISARLYRVREARGVEEWRRAGCHRGT